MKLYIKLKLYIYEYILKNAVYFGSHKIQTFVLFAHMVDLRRQKVLFIFHTVHILHWVIYISAS